MEKQTKNLLIHTAVMVCISLAFMIYFRSVENNPELQKQIIDNASILPNLQLLAYGGYVGYIALKLIPMYREKRKINRDLQNVMLLVGRTFLEYVIWVVDLFAITIIFLSFFIYGNPHPSPKIFGVMDISDAYFLIIAPGLMIIANLLLFRNKLKYR